MQESTCRWVLSWRLFNIYGNTAWAIVLTFYTATLLKSQVKHNIKLPCHPPSKSSDKENKKMFQHRQIFEVSNTSFCNLEIFQNTFEQFWLNALPDADDDMLLEKKTQLQFKKKAAFTCSGSRTERISSECWEWHDAMSVALQTWQATETSNYIIISIWHTVTGSHPRHALSLTG